MRVGISIPIRFHFRTRMERSEAAKGHKFGRDIRKEQKRLKRQGDPDFLRNGVTEAYRSRGIYIPGRVD